MSNRPGPAGTDGDSGMAYEGEPAEGIPRWVKLALIVIVLVALVIAVMLLLSDGEEHGPGRHGPGGSGGQAPPSSAPAVHVSPPGGHG